MATLYTLLAAPAALPQAAETPIGGQKLPDLVGVEHAEFYRLVKHFDFDERVQGNYEDTPMHWVQLRGEGLPTLYARGRLDDEVGREAPPSFRLDIQTGNVAYEYRHYDLAVIPGSDYFLVGYVRAQGLEFSRAFVAAYFIDRFGERIPGSERVSNLVGATGNDPEPWQRVEIALPGEFPTADALGLQFWILQAHAWRKPDPRGIDPILRRDVYGTAWFDDVSIYRLPRLQLCFSNPGGLVLPGQREEFILEVNNATSQSLSAELRVTDRAGQLHHMKRLEVSVLSGPAGLAPPGPSSSDATNTGELTPPLNQQSYMSSVHVAVPELAPGFYQAQLQLLGDSGTLLERNTHFVVLPELPPRSPPHADIGVDLGCWQRSDSSGLRGLLAALECGAVKIGIPMVGDLDTEEKKGYFRELSGVLRDLAENRIDATGVILSPSAAVDPEQGDSTRQLVSGDADWRKLSSPILAPFGALLPTWQLGSEEIELRDRRPWRSADVERVRSYLRSFVTIPKLAIPQAVTAVRPHKDDVISVWVPAELPTRALPRHLGFLVDGDASLYWLQLATSAPSDLDNTRRANDLARRLVLAKALNPGRVFLPAPFELSKRGGRPAWQPTEDYLVLRTLFHYLSGKTAVAAMRPASDTLGVVFEGVDSSCMVVWSWRERPPSAPVELYLGPNPRAINVWGQPVPLEVARGRTRLPVGPTPLIVEELDSALALFQASYSVAPTYVQLHEAEPRPVLAFRNTYDTRLSGEVRLTPPGSWQVEPATRTFLLEPGEKFTQPLTFTFPPRQIAQGYELGVHLILHAPQSAELRFREALMVGLREIGLRAAARWEGDDLVIEQSLHNFSDQPVSFTAFCEPPGRVRVETEFLDVMPGELSTRAYLFPNSRPDLAGMLLHMGIQEIGGARSLNQFAEVPQ